MSKRKPLNVVNAKDEGLGRPTIMDRALAARYGTDYVYLAAFSIDVDRVLDATDEDDFRLPFAWEVRLTEAYLMDTMNPRDTPRDFSIIEETCLGILERKEKPAPAGSQLPFAIFCLVNDGRWPESLADLFRGWPRLPVDMAEEVAEMRKNDKLLARLCQHCVTVDLDPPLVQPVRDALARLEGL